MDALQDQVQNGNLEWLNRISYYSQRVTGSNAYWRAKRREVFSWINYHVEKKNGLPSLFITLSCAEYFWPDIERLIIDRYIVAGLAPPDVSKNHVGLVNDHCIVVQEYFQLRVETWLDTVGKKLLGIKHYWLRYEFAPSRGQIHAHLLAICDHRSIQEKCFELKDDRTELAKYLSDWMEKRMGMTASVPDLYDDEKLSKKEHPSKRKFSEILEAFPDRSKNNDTGTTQIVEENLNRSENNDSGKVAKGDDDLGTGHSDCKLSDGSETLWKGSLETSCKEDAAACQRFFLNHKCSDYCMRKRTWTKKDESSVSKRRRVCRCGFGVEQNAGKCDTGGFHLSTEPKLVCDLRGFDRVDMPRNNKRVVQSSMHVAQGWRANCDVQFLIYKCHPDRVDPSDVARVTNYIVSYNCKGTEREVEEKKSMKAIIMASREESGTKADLRKLAKRLLNESAKGRVISRQEATCQLADLNLFLCSERIETVSVAGECRLGGNKKQDSTFLSKYAHRTDHLEVSLNDYFEVVKNDGVRNGRKWTVPHYVGAKTEAVYPPTSASARGALLVYSPWHGEFPLKKNDDIGLLETFNTCLKAKLFPDSLLMAYANAKEQCCRPETVSRSTGVDYESFAYNEDPEVQDVVDLASTLFDRSEFTGDPGESDFDFGFDTDWSKQNYEVRTARCRNW